MTIRIAAVVLAAGSSRRFGANKLRQMFRGKPLLCHAVEVCLASSAAPVIVVTGGDSGAIEAMLTGLPIELVHNEDHSTGLSSSLKCGIKRVPPQHDGAAVVLGDMPLLSSALLNRLIDMFSPASCREIILPVQGGRRGHPVLWGRRFFPDILALSGDQGAKALLSAHSDLVYELAVEDAGIHIDIDTPEDLARYE